jgi:hypothetical protein
MKISKLPLLAAIIPLAATLFLAPAQLRADTYQIFDLGSDNNRSINGIDNLGDVVIFNGTLSEFLTYSNGVLVNTTSTLPSLIYDDGTPCSAPSGFSIAAVSVCNNGRIGFGSRANTNGEPGGVYTGPVASLTGVEIPGSNVAAFLNSSGDFAWTDGFIEENFEAIDLTTRATPEPTSLLLVGTGCFSLLGVLRKKLS